MNTKTVYIAAGQHVYAVTVRETDKCWITDASYLWCRTRRVAKPGPYPWRDTPTEAAKLQLERRQLICQRLRDDLIKASAEADAALKLVALTRDPAFLMEDRRTDAPLDSKLTFAQLSAPKEVVCA